MSRLDCERWASLFDRRSVDDPLSEDEMAFSRQHEASCAECRRELGVWESFGGVVAETKARAPVDSLALTELLRKRLAAETAEAPKVVPISAAQKPLRRRTAYVGAVLALAASVALVVRSQREQPAATRAADVHVTLASADGAVDQKAAEAGALVREGVHLRAAGGPLCLSIEPSVRACLADGSEAILADASLAHRRFDLKKGRILGFARSTAARDDVHRVDRSRDRDCGRHALLGRSAGRRNAHHRAGRTRRGRRASAPRR